MYTGSLLCLATHRALYACPFRAVRQPHWSLNRTIPTNSCWAHRWAWQYWSCTWNCTESSMHHSVIIWLLSHVASCMLQQHTFAKCRDLGAASIFLFYSNALRLILCHFWSGHAVIGRLTLLTMQSESCSGCWWSVLGKKKSITAKLWSNFPSCFALKWCSAKIMNLDTYFLHYTGSCN